jgi:hypothetical protein
MTCQSYKKLVSVSSSHQMMFMVQGFSRQERKYVSDLHPNFSTSLGQSLEYVPLVYKFKSSCSEILKIKVQFDPNLIWMFNR